MPIEQNVGISASTEASFNSFANLSLKPLLQFIAAECVTSRDSSSNFSIVDFVVQLLLANKDHLEQTCRCAHLPASAIPKSYAPQMPALPSAAAGAREMQTAAAHHVQQNQVTDAHADALKFQLRESEAPHAFAGASLPEPLVRLSLCAVDLTTGTMPENASVASSRVCVEAGIRRRDRTFLREVFHKYQDQTLKPPRILHASLPDAMADLFASAAESGSNAPSTAPPAVLEAAKLGDSRGVDFDGFVASAGAASQFERYVNKLPLACIVADALSAHVGFEDDALQRFSQMPKSELDSAMQAAMTGLKAELARAQAAVCDLLAAQQKSLDQLASGKFQNPRKMACGSISDFHAGLTGRIGSPSLDFEPAMRAEHCFKGGHDYEFTTGNYKIKTTPEREWLQIVGDENGLRAAVPDEDMKHGRVIVDVSELLKRPLAVTARLQRCEVIALSLYSGPLFEIYNCLLRQFPLDKYNTFNDQDNTFSTTIFVLVSAIQKLSRHMYLPPSTRLYRGFSSMEMPDSFFKVDEDTGCCGYAEWGFISTSANKNVAIQYSGVDQGKPRATVLCIRPTSVDRGASIAEFSQCVRVSLARCCCAHLARASGTPARRSTCGRRARFCSRRTRAARWRCRREGESSPCALPASQTRACFFSQFVCDDACCSVSVRVNANLRTETVEELVEKKKRMHVTSARLLADEVKGELERLVLSTESVERKKKVMTPDSDVAFRKFSARINRQCDAIVERHRNTGAANYVNDNTFRGLVSEILNMKSWAMEKWQLWLKDESRFLEQMKGFSLLECHRLWLGHLRKRIREAAPDSDERRLACLQLLQSKGLVKVAARGELNADGEDLIVAAGAEGWSAADVSALLGAGAHVATADDNGHTGVWNAASCGHVSTLKALLDGGGDASCCSNDSKHNQKSGQSETSALQIAAMNGHVDCAEELIASKADVLQCNT
jgi:hypothetical protein